jgi:hypothetical protein
VINIFQAVGYRIASYKNVREPQKEPACRRLRTAGPDAAVVQQGYLQPSDVLKGRFRSRNSSGLSDMEM